MKRRILALLVSLALIGVLFILPASAAASAAKHTANAQGGGFFVSSDPSSVGHKVSFGFSAWLDTSGNIDGNLQAYDQEDKVHVKGRPTSYPYLGIDPVGTETFPANGWMYGYCTVNGEDGYTFSLAFSDYRDKVTLYSDWIRIDIYDEDGNLIYLWWSNLDVGNIRISKP